MDSDETIIQEKARELVALLERARDLLRGAEVDNRWPGNWSTDEQVWQRDVKALLDN